MNDKTLFSGRIGCAARPLYRVTHAGLLVAGMVALAYFLSGSAEWPSLSAPWDAAQATAADEAPAAHKKHLSHEMARAQSWLSRRYKVSTLAIEPALRAAEDSGRRFGVDPMLLVAMIAVESSFNPLAESNMGAQGLMQVIPRYHMDKIGQGKGARALFDPELNVRVGAQVLKEGLRRYGSLESALQYYGGALNDPDAAYANKVLTMKQRIAAAARARGNAA
ncbi:MAG: transglycosylase SLT domain-containing protein [Azoarcus sp.]|jgi:soluble lytic murein transglycosylase-like protein|nr:transglycosylase SLT domain-containing protein [Azoarcus sp.]